MCQPIGEAHSPGQRAQTGVGEATHEAAAWLPGQVATLDVGSRAKAEGSQAVIVLAGVFVSGMLLRGYLQTGRGRPQMGADFSGLVAISEGAVSGPRSNGMGTPGTKSGKPGPSLRLLH
jgi:hypothetical protein